jgi:hypothetical protein
VRLTQGFVPVVLGVAQEGHVAALPGLRQNLSAIALRSPAWSSVTATSTPLSPRCLRLTRSSHQFEAFSWLASSTLFDYGCRIGISDLLSSPAP